MSPGFRIRVFEPRSAGEDALLVPYRTSTVLNPGHLPFAFADTQGLRPNRLGNPELAVDDLGWGANAATGTRDTGTHLGAAGMAPASYKIITTNVGSSGPVIQDVLGRVAIVPGRLYGFSVHVEATGGVGKPACIFPHWYDATGALISATPSAPTTLVAGWQRLAHVAVAPANAARVLFAVYPNTAAGVYTLYFTGAQIEDVAASPFGGTALDATGEVAFSSAFVRIGTVMGNPALDAAKANPLGRTGAVKVITSSDAANAEGVIYLPDGGLRVPAQAGQRWSFGAWVDFTGATGLSYQARITFRDAALTALQTTQTGFTTAAGWAWVSHADAVAPAGTAVVECRVSETTAGTAVTTFWTCFPWLAQTGIDNTVEGSGQVGLYNPTAYGYPGLIDRCGGRRGTLDPLDGDYKPGNLAVSFLDRKTSLGGSEAARVLTAFAGDALGAPQLGGLLTEIDYSEDLTAAVVAWERWFTGRVDDHQLEDGITIGLTVADLAQDLEEAEIFVSGRPHSSVTEAVEAQAWPLGLSGAFGTFPLAPVMTGTIGNAATGGGKAVLLGSASKNASENVVLKGLVAEGLALGPTSGVPKGRVRYVAGLRARVKQTSGGGAGTIAEYEVGGVTTQRVVMLTGKTTAQPNVDAAKHGYEIHSIYLRALPGGTAVPADGTSVEVSLRIPFGTLSPEVPLLLNDVHPATVLAYALDGKFGPLDGAGAVTRTFRRDTASFTTLAADPTLPSLRLIRTGRQKVREFCKEVCRQTGLGYRVDEYGRVVLMDLRMPTSLAGVPSLTDLDLDRLPTKGHAFADAIAEIVGTIYLDRSVAVQETVLDAGILDGDSATLLKSVERLFTPLVVGRRDLGDRVLRIEGTGFRSGLNELTAGMDRETVLRGQLLAVAEDRRAAFGYGPERVQAHLRRNATTRALREGALVLYDWSVLPNPATNQRGGQRVGRILERNEERGGPLRFSLLDLGPNVQLNVPTVGALGTEAGNTLNGITVPLTLNAQGDPVAVDVAITDSSVTLVANVPAAAWVRVALVTSTQTLTVKPLPSGARVWVRAFAVPGPTSTAKLPSPYAYSSGTDYVDLAALSAPTGLAVSGISQLGAQLDWSAGGDQVNWVKLYLASPSTDPLTFVRYLPAGTVQHIVAPTTNAATYKAAVSLWDGAGESPLSGTVTWTASGTPASCPPPLALELYGLL